MYDDNITTQDYNPPETNMNKNNTNTSNMAIAIIIIFVFLIIVSVISMISLCGVSQANTDASNNNADIDNLYFTTTGITYNSLLPVSTNIANNLVLSNNLTVNGTINNTAITTAQNSLASIENSVTGITTSNSQQLTVNKPTTFNSNIKTNGITDLNIISANNLNVSGTINNNAINTIQASLLSIENNIPGVTNVSSEDISFDKPVIFNSAITTNGITDLNNISANNFTCSGFFGGLKAYITFNPTTKTVISSLNCSYVSTAVGIYTVTVPSTVTGIVGFPFLSTSAYTCFLSQTSNNVYVITCRGGGSSPSNQDPNFVAFGLM